MHAREISINYILMGKLERKTSLRIFRSRLNNNIKVDFEEIG
jgi:hypothetical protein